MLPAIKANALYGGGYPLFTALGRPLIAKIAVEKAREAGCDAIAHGCTGKGNDQVRLDSAVLAYAPDMKIVAPVRNWAMGREEEIAYAREHGIPVKGGTEAPPYSIDDNLWGRSSEGGPIEDLGEPPRDDVFELVADPREAPDEPQLVEIEFEQGRPVAIDGERLGLVELLDKAAEIGCRHGVGIVDHIEDRIVGLKVRDLYEVPAAEMILTAHKELEKLVGTIHQNRFKPALDEQWAFLVYAGLWYEPLLENLNAFMDSVNEQVTGKITLQLYRGSCKAVRRESPNALYDAGARELRRVGRAVLAAVEPGLHRAVDAPVADGLRDPEPQEMRVEAVSRGTSHGIGKDNEDAIRLVAGPGRRGRRPRRRDGQAPLARAQGPDAAEPAPGPPDPRRAARGARRAGLRGRARRRWART